MVRFRPVLASAVFSAIVLAILLLTPTDAQAYLDPGTGSYVIQLAMAGLLASMFTLKLYWQRIKDWFRGNKPAEPPAVTTSKVEPGKPDEPR
jgi:hypothetical protein